jgi:hypothetical protein
MSTATKTPGDKVKKVLKWVKEMLDEHPEKTRKDVFKEAEIRFDLTPMECEFINNNFVDDGKDC